MGFGGHVSDMNSRMKQFWDKSKRRHEHRQKLLENSRMDTKNGKNEIHEKPLSDIDRKQLDEELKQERLKSNMKEILAVLLAIVTFLLLIWYMFF